jgi:hypothetical protein
MYRSSYVIVAMALTVRLHGRRVARLAAVSGCDGANPSWATVCAATLVILTCTLPTCKSGAVLDL